MYSVHCYFCTNKADTFSCTLQYLKKAAGVFLYTTEVLRRISCIHCSSDFLRTILVIEMNCNICMCISGAFVHHVQSCIQRNIGIAMPSMRHIQVKTAKQLVEVIS